MRVLMAGLAVALLAACSSSGEPPPQEGIVEDGREISMSQCAGCHAVGEYGDSANPDAPPFRTLLSRYNAEVLEEELIAGIQVTHVMPGFQFNPQGADALIAYIRSIQTNSEEAN